ncbi:MAG TPA: molybdopterin-dependent oxidoreductase [Candidatus Acidoferrum sp.]|nr:molybdopterin-dependent oxidoreductase [Candidatus Acidoferrum sp.]
MEISNERNGHARRRASSDTRSNELVSADSQRLTRYAYGMKSQKSRFVLLCAVLIVLVATVFLIPCEAFAQQAAATPSTQASSSTSAKDELRISAHAYHEDLVLKVADLKAMPRTTVTVHNEHSKADESYAGVRLADVLAKMGAPLGHGLRGAALSAYIVATGSDGYVAVIALAEADPAFHSGEVIVADTMNGALLDAKSGPFKLVVTEDKRPARWVRNLVSIELKSAK